MKSKNMVEGKSKKTEQAKRGTKDGMDKEPIEEGVFDLPLILDLLLLCVFGFLSLYSFWDYKKRIGSCQICFDNGLDPDLNRL